MNKLIFICLATCYVNANAQGRLSAGIMVSPDFTYSWDVPSIPLVGYSGGVSGFYQLSKHFYLNSGVWYSSKGYKTQTVVLFPDNSLRNATNIYRFIDWEIPVLLNYRTIKSRLGFTATTGVIFGFSQKETLNAQTATTNYTYNTKSAQPQPDRVNLTLAAGIICRINQKFSLLLEPNAKVNIKPIYNARVNDEVIKSFGLRTSIIHFF